jgi:4-amino-4-deoxy-L-arabinose transferase-like glycosyltransferase
MQKVSWFAFFICLLFFLVSYIDGLTILPLRYDDDEARRALVTAEMMLSGDYITPTINGEIYLNKPPLYNWIVSGYFRVFGDYSMFAFRLQVIVALLLTGFVIYRFTKKHTSELIAFFTAFAYMTNGRILIYDSFIGLIDTSFTLVVFLSFMLIYHFGEKKKYYHLFLFTYALAALGFLMKGMPALVFQGLTLITYFTWRKKFRVLFQLPHFAGIGLFLVITGSYYLSFFNRNELDPLIVFGNLLNESSKRTPGHFSIGRNILHFFSFPLEMLFHYAPWTLFVVALFQKKLGPALRRNDFIFYCLLVFLVNFPLYWLSPEVYPRYLFMFLPLIFSIFFYLYFEILDENSWQHKLVNIVIIVICVVLFVTFLILPFTGLTKQAVFYPVVLAIIMAFLIWYFFRVKEIRLFVFLLALLVFRMGFNWFILTERAVKYKVAEARGEEIARITNGKGLFILQGSSIGNFDGLSFHIATRRGEVLKIRELQDTSVFYIADKKMLAGKNYTSYFSFPNFYAEDSLQLVKFR